MQQLLQYDVLQERLKLKKICKFPDIIAKRQFDFEIVESFAEDSHFCMEPAMCEGLF